MSIIIDTKTVLARCAEGNLTIGQVMLEREVELQSVPAAEHLARMAKSWRIMQEAAKAAVGHPIKSMGGLIGGEAQKLAQTAKRERMALSGLARRAVTYAMSVMEVNASMGLIVATPTAGSAGVLPGVLLSLKEEYGFEDEAMIDALFAAGCVGFLINQSATLAGAEGGCQAEVGSAAAMAAAATVQLLGGPPEKSMDAASISLTNMLGLVCDPVRGLVELPCQLRNAQGAGTALTAAELALSGIGAPAPLEQMIPIMYRVGQSISVELRETALGGTATAPIFKATACDGCRACE